MTKEKKIDDLFSKENEAQANWFKFEKVGDKIGGILVGKEDAPAKGKYEPQKVYVLELADGSIKKVGIKVSKKGTVDRAESARFGDSLGFERLENIPAKEKGHAPAHPLRVYIDRKKVESENEIGNF